MLFVVEKIPLMALLLGLTILFSMASSTNVNATEPNDTSTATYQLESNSSFQNTGKNNITSDSNVNTSVGHNAATGGVGVIHLGKTKVSSLARAAAPPSGVQQLHVIPFHPKNLTAFLAAKRQADLGLIKPSVKVFAIPSSTQSSINSSVAAFFMYQFR